MYRKLSSRQFLAPARVPTMLPGDQVPPNLAGIDNWDQLGDDYKRDFLATHSTFLKGKGYDFIHVIARGGFGSIWLVERTANVYKNGQEVATKEKIACKVLSMSYLHFNRRGKELNFPSAYEYLTREADIYCQLIHPNIVSRIEVFYVNDKEKPCPIHAFLFMELMEGDLNDIIHGTLAIDLPEQQTIEWLKQIVSGLWYMHDKNISHMDIKPNNILYSKRGVGYDEQYIYKLTDFGVSKRFRSPDRNVVTGLVGTPGYLAPEMAKGQITETKPADIYSLGITVAESIGEDNYSVQEVVDFARNKDLSFGLSVKMLELLEMMTRVDPIQRPNIQQIRDYLTKEFPDYNEAYYGVTKM